MKTSILLSTLIIIATLSNPAQAQTIFEVDALTDEPDINAGDGTCLSINGVCSLRAAIEEANALPNGLLPDIIHFTNIPVTAGTASIDVINLALPRITEPLIIDGSTAAGEVILDGINNTTDPWLLPNGLELASGSDGSKIRGVSVINFGRNGIYVTSDDNVIIDNYVGTTSAGAPQGNDQYAVYVSGNNNTIGKPGLGNTVAFNEGQAVYIHVGSNNKVQSNYIGTNADGDDWGNEASGILISGGINNVIGGPTLAHGNIIGFNDREGIYIYDSNANIIRNNYVGTDHSFRDIGNGQEGIKILVSEDNIVGGPKVYGNVIGFNDEGIRLGGPTIVRGNYIGTNAAGDNLGNNTDGIRMSGSLASGSTIGYLRNATFTLDAPRGNVIAFNGGSGIVVEDEYIPVNNPVQNTFRGNQIFENAGIGIDLGGEGITANDSDDADEGANTYLNYPDIDRAFYRGGNHAIVVEYEITSDSTIVSYPLTVDVYLADDDISAEGKTYIGSDTYTTPNLTAQFEVSADSITWSATDYIVMTATDASGNMSEFSPAAGALGGPGSVAAVHDSGQAFAVSAYPNPFNPQPTISLTLPKASHVQISVHDMLGRQVALLHDADLASGITHTFTFDGARLASGTYLLRVAGGGFVETQRIVLLK